MKTSRRALLQTITAGSALAAAGLAQAKDAPKFDVEADVVVVGLGAAGAAAAITAADRKASVVAIDRQPLETLRSNTRMSGGYIHCPPRDGDMKALQAYFEALFSASYAGLPSVGEEDDLSRRLARHWTEITPTLADWLKSQDPELKMLGGASKPQYVNFPGAAECSYAVYRTSYKDVVDNKTTTYNRPKSEATEGEALHRALMNGLERRSGRITLMGGVRALDLITDASNRVVGITALRDGKPVRIGARRGVALCCGGYEYGAPMRKAFLSGPAIAGWAFYGTTFNEGDGIVMGLKAGAALTKAPACAARMLWAPPVEVRGMRIGVTTNNIGSPNTIVVNSLGERFVNESLITGGITNNCFYEKACEQSLETLTYDNLPSWLIMESRVFRTRPLANVTRSTVGYGFVDFKDNADALKKGWILEGETIEELARKIAATGGNSARMRPEALRRTVDEFNAACDAGSDPKFGRIPGTLRPIRRGPFYAVPLFAGGSNTKGGLTTDADRRVLDWAGRPIPGLFSAGEIACGLNRGGAMLTDALVFGIVCGRTMTAQG